MVHISAHILHPFWGFRLFRKWDKGMDINPEDQTSCTTQYQKTFLKYVENEYSAKHQFVLVNTLESVLHSNIIPSSMASGFYQSCFDPYDLSSYDNEYLTPNNVAEMSPGQSDRAAS